AFDRAELHARCDAEPGYRSDQWAHETTRPITPHPVPENSRTHRWRAFIRHAELMDAWRETKRRRAARDN
ncbi:MAG: hypothetical protein AAFV77_11620, partial [Planctomycetota bacterium]